MSLEKIEIPVPRLRPRVGAGVLFVALGAVAAFSAAVIREQHWQLLWMDNHPPVLGQGFDIGFGDGIIRRSTWLPRHIYRGPHPLAIAAGIVNIIVCIALAVLFLASVGFKKVSTYFILPFPPSPKTYCLLGGPTDQALVR